MGVEGSQENNIFPDMSTKKKLNDIIDDEKAMAQHVYVFKRNHPRINSVRIFS